MPEQSPQPDAIEGFGVLLQRAATPICVTRGPTHRIEIMNAAFEAASGIHGARGRPFRDICRTADVEPQLGMMDRAFAADERLVATEVVVRTPPAVAAAGGAISERLFTFVYEPLHDREGAVDGLVISAVEITDDVAGRRDLQEAQQRSKFLVDASAALSESLDYERTLRQVADLTVPRIADWCTVSAIDEHGDLQRLAVVHRDPVKRALVQEYETRFPPTQHRAGDLASVLSMDHAILRAQVPDTDLIEAAQSADHLRILRGLGCASCIMAPMIARGERVGVISLMRSSPDRPYGANDVAVAEELARRAALAIDNARLYRAAQRREQTMSFLAEASAVLSSSLDYEAAFDKVAQLVVPSFADWCVLDIKEGEQIRHVAVAHVDPDKVELARDLQRRYPPDANASRGSVNVMRTGRPELHADISDEMLVRGARDGEHLRVSRALGLRSALVVPLVGRGPPIGALTLVWAETGHRYQPEDVAVMEELGRRAGFALENARLYGETQSAVRLRDEFISIASHELKTPLTSMQLQISGIRRAAGSPARLDPAKLARRVDAIDKQVGRLTELVDGLLDVSRAAAGRLRLNVEDVDLGQVVSSVAERFADQLAQARCVLTIDIRAPGDPGASGATGATGTTGTTGTTIIGRWDRLRVDDIVTNLLGNAIKYGPGRPIQLTAGVSGSVATVQVRDHGIGIAADDQLRIFQRFARAVSSEHYGGFGLGLWIVHVLVQAMGGSVDVTSAVGEGALFTVRLPLQTVQS